MTPLGRTDRIVVCRGCGAHNDSRTHIEDEAVEAGPGDVMLCWECGTVSIITDEWTGRQPTGDEYDTLLTDVAFVRALALLRTHIGERS